jgi:hypothetical protein
MGYPATHRQGYETTINARILPICDFATDVGPRRFTIADESEGRRILINPESLTFPTHVGGMSGSPVFKVSDNTIPDFVVYSQTRSTVSEEHTFVVTRIFCFPAAN